MCRCACCFTMHRVPVLVKTALQHNASLLRGELVATKAIRKGERIILKPQGASDNTPKNSGAYGKRLGFNDSGSDPVFDDKRYAY